MTLKRKSLLGGINRFRLMLTLVLAVLLPAAALIYAALNVTGSCKLPFIETFRRRWPSMKSR